MASRAGEGFPKALRLKSRRQFLEVQGEGVKVSAGPLLGLAKKNGSQVTRLGLTVSSKVGNAVERARIKRRLRELFRRQRARLPEGLDVVLIARQSAREADFAALSQAFDAVAVGLRGLFP